MKSVYKKVSVIALSSMIIAGGIASSGINAQAYSPELNGQIQDLGSGRGKEVYNDAKQVVEKAGAIIEAIYSSSAAMNRYVRDNYWDRVQGHSPSAKKAKEELLKAVDCGDDPRKLESEIKKHALGDVFRVKYKRYIILVRVNYKNLSQIPAISGRDIENLDRENQRLYRHHMEGKIKEAGYKVVKIYDENKANNKIMQEYIKDRFRDGVFKGDKLLKEDLLVGLHSNSYEAFLLNLKYNRFGDVMRLFYDGIDMLLIRDK